MDCLDVINIQHLRSLEQGQDILANHARPEAENTGEPPYKKLASEAGVEASNGGASEKPMRMSLREKSLELHTTNLQTNVTASLLSANSIPQPSSCTSLK